MLAYQRIIAERMARELPRERPSSLEHFKIETISRNDATPLISAYEWLGTVGRSTFFVGLISPQQELFGVACFGYGPAGPIRTLIGEPAMCLERGACVHYAPVNAASFLINAACKLVHRVTGTAKFFAYADPVAGEYGGVYQAAGWAYLGQGLDGKKGRRQRYVVLPPGADREQPTSWKTTRELRRELSVYDKKKKKWRGLSFDEAKSQGWEIGKHPAKHVYAVFVGGRPRDRKAWRAQFGLPYPAPRPTLKRKALVDGSFLIQSPPAAQTDLFVSRFDLRQSK